MYFLTSLSSAVLTIGCLLLFGGYAVLLTIYLHRRFTKKTGAPYAHTAEYFNTVLGSLFAFLTAFLINSAYATIRTTNEIVASEASAANRVAWATRGLPSADVSSVQEGLAKYLSALETKEWPHLGEARSSDLSEGDTQVRLAGSELNALQQEVFEVSARTYVPNLSAEALQSAVDDLGAERRARLAASNTILPFSLFFLAVISGFALITNVLITSLKDGRKTAWVSVGIVLIVGLSISVILGLTAPFNGPHTVKIDPIVTLYQEISGGRFLPWAQG